MCHGVSHVLPELGGFCVRPRLLQAFIPSRVSFGCPRPVPPCTHSPPCLPGLPRCPENSAAPQHLSFHLNHAKVTATSSFSLQLPLHLEVGAGSLLGRGFGGPPLEGVARRRGYHSVESCVTPHTREDRKVIFLTAGGETTAMQAGTVAAGGETTLRRGGKQQQPQVVGQH